MIRYSNGGANKSLFGPKTNQLQECFSYFPVSNSNGFGVSVGLKYGKDSAPLFSLVKHRGTPVTNSYIYLQAKEIEALINVLQDEELRYGAAPTDRKLVVNDLTRPMVVFKKEWPGKTWTLFNIHQSRKGRQFEFETPSFNIEKILKALIRVNELARVRSTAIQPEDGFNLILPMAVAYKCDQQMRSMNQSLGEVEWTGLVDTVYNEDDQVEDIFDYLNNLLLTGPKPDYPIDVDELMKKDIPELALKFYTGDYDENEMLIDVDLIYLLIEEFVKAQK